MGYFSLPAYLNGTSSVWVALLAAQSFAGATLIHHSRLRRWPLMAFGAVALHGCGSASRLPSPISIPNDSISNGASPFSVRAIWCDFRFRGWECDFRTPEAIPYRMVQVSSLCVPSGAQMGGLNFALMPTPPPWAEFEKTPPQIFPFPTHPPEGLKPNLAHGGGVGIHGPGSGRGDTVYGMGT